MSGLKKGDKARVILSTWANLDPPVGAIVDVLGVVAYEDGEDQATIFTSWPNRLHPENKPGWWMSSDQLAPVEPIVGDADSDELDRDHLADMTESVGECNVAESYGRPGPLRTAITWSSYSTAQTCRRAYWYRYCEGIEIGGANEAKADPLVIGDAVHRLCAGERTIPDLPEHLGPIVSTMAAAWLLRWQETEVTPSRQIEAWVTDEIEVGEGFARVLVTVGAHCDEIRDLGDRRVVVERKTAGRVDGHYLERLALDQQIALQAYLADVDTVLYDVIQVAPIKREVGETDEEFALRRSKAKAKNASGKTTITRRQTEALYTYQQRLARWYLERPSALLRCEVVIDQARKISAVTQVAGLAHRLRLDQDAVVHAEDHGSELDARFPQSTQRCFDWSRRCEYWNACTSGDNELVKQELYAIRTKREGDPPTNREIVK